MHFELSEIFESLALMLHKQLRNLLRQLFIFKQERGL
jgi:hypothetical protein